jgi:hypothetical protein
MRLLREYTFLGFFINLQWAVIPTKLADHGFPVSAT